MQDFPPGVSGMRDLSHVKSASPFPEASQAPLETHNLGNNELTPVHVKDMILEDSDVTIKNRNFGRSRKKIERVQIKNGVR